MSFNALENQNAQAPSRTGQSTDERSPLICMMCMMPSSLPIMPKKSTGLV